jgi:tetratricopeptide (TPR) repeat protein
MAADTTARAQADQLVRQGLRHHDSADPAPATRLYEQALAHVPDHPAALQLLGLLARRRGAQGEAESLLKRSLQAAPAQPAVWNNLGNLFAATARNDEALAAFEQALLHDGSMADAHYNRARVLQRLGRAADALAALDRALALSHAPNVAMLQLRGSVLADLGRLDDALAATDAALARAPDRPALLHNRATVLQRCHRHAEALQAHQRAQALGLDVADAHYNLGNTLQSLGRHDEAAAAYRRALAREPLHALALYDLARLRWRQGDPGFDAELRGAIAAAPRSALPCGIHANLLWRAERWADAEQAFALALQREPGSPRWHDGLGRCRVRLGALPEGLAHHARAVALAPQLAELRINHACSLLIARRPDAAAREAEAALALAPLDQQALALLGLAWRLLGDPREAWLNDHERQVQVVDLPPPPGHADMDTFMQALAAELRGLHGDRAAPVDQTLRHGTQTLGDIFEQGHPLVNLLKQRIAEAVSAYVAALPEDASHPFLSRRGAGWRFTDSWSSRLSRGGFHTAHVHPHGWVSSACYVTVPPVVADTQRRQGWLEFGRPDIDIGLTEPVRKVVQPRPGRLALFPSMCWHGTSAFDSDDERMTIAFDVMPV